jgi:hypothetical protein
MKSGASQYYGIIYMSTARKKPPKDALLAKKRRRTKGHVWYIPKGPGTWMQHLAVKQGL